LISRMNSERGLRSLVANQMVSKLAMDKIWT
jgi:hypothetical protein